MGALTALTRVRMEALVQDLFANRLDWACKISVQEARFSIIGPHRKQVRMPPRLGSQVLVGTADAGAEVRRCVPRPARVVDHSSGECDEVGVARPAVLASRHRRRPVGWRAARGIGAADSRARRAAAPHRFPGAPLASRLARKRRARRRGRWRPARRELPRRARKAWPKARLYASRLDYDWTRSLARRASCPSRRALRRPLRRVARPSAA